MKFYGHEVYINYFRNTNLNIGLDRHEYGKNYIDYPRKIVTAVRIRMRQINKT
jgi:hypothetical protein